MQLVSKISLATCDFNKNLTLKWISHIATCIIGKYFPRFSYKLQNMKQFAKYEKLGKYFPYCTRHRAITVTYCLYSSSE